MGGALAVGRGFYFIFHRPKRLRIFLLASVMKKVMKRSFLSPESYLIVNNDLIREIDKSLNEKR
jgi:hypothetical protein